MAVRFLRAFAIFVALVVDAFCGSRAAADTPPDPVLFADIILADARLEAIGYRLITANAGLCRDTFGATGLRLQRLADYSPAYRQAAANAFGFSTPAGVEAVVATSPAALAGIRAGDGIVSIGADPSPATPPATPRSAADGTAVGPATLLDLPADRPVALALARNGVVVSLILKPRTACRSRFELLLGKNYEAYADGDTVQVGAGFLRRLSDGKLAAVVAHELAHNILGHRRRIEQQGIHGGLAGEFGRSARLTLAMEDAADRLSLRLLANAGYDPHEAVALWRDDGAAISGWIPRGLSHRGWRQRAALLEAELTTPPDRSRGAPQ